MGDSGPCDPLKTAAPNYGDKTMPIAVVGMACRYPGDVTDPERLWQMCAEQRDVWQPIPKERFNQDIFYHPDPSRNGTSNVRGAHFLQEHPGFFDAQFFNMTDAEATSMDPQQRIMLECAYEALENAGIPLDQVAGSEAAVFMGSSCRDYTDLLLDDLDKTELYQATGTGQTMLANRVSYFFDLKGPSITVDTACSSSLVALHLACNSIRAGESNLGIVGGSNLILGPAAIISLSMLRFLSPDGRCFSFDDRGNGFGRGEGVGCIILRPLEEALKSRDTIRAVIRNSGTNQDGKTSGITLPSGQAQVELMEHLYRSAGLDPAETSYVEAHGTGTAAGDPIEASSLAKVFSTRRPFNNALKVGSIKSNMGHLEGGSGIAGVMKTILMLEKGIILPNFDFKKANPRIPMRDWRMEVPTVVHPWRHQDIRRASVNNFGFGGSNAHVIIDDADSYLNTHDIRNPHMKNGISLSGVEIEQTRLFVLSAFDEHAGIRQAKRLAEYIETHSDNSSGHFLADLEFTLGERRSKLPWRAGIHANSLSHLVATLDTGIIKFTKALKAPTIGFLFTGQGAQWHAMGRELILTYRVFHDSLLLADKYLRRFGASWSLLEELSRDATTSRVGNALLSQPVCTAIQVALIDLLSSWNIKPVSVTGHSSGEIAAAYAAGALTLESALAVAYYRGVAAAAVKNVKSLKRGAMLAVGLSVEETQALTSELNRGIVSIACINSPTSVTVSGDEPAVEELLNIIHEKGSFARKLAVDTAYHSHHMEHVAESYYRAIKNIEPISSSNVEFYSSVSGKRIELSELGPSYWVANLVSPVQFSDSIQNLCLGTESKRRKRRGATAAVDILVEIGPHSALSGPIKQNLQSNARLKSSVIEYLSVLVRNKNAVDTALRLAGGLFEYGVPINLHAINSPNNKESNRVLIDLPPYAWNHSTSYWARGDRNGKVEFPRSDFLGIPSQGSTASEPQWRNIMRTSEIPWILDHNVQSNTVCPAACFLSMAIEAAYQRATLRGAEFTGYKLREISIGHALIISQSDEVETKLSLRPYNESLRVPSELWDEFCISSSTDGITWTEHCRGLIAVKKRREATEVDDGRNAREEQEDYDRMITNFRDACTTEVETTEIYSALKELGLNFGPTFANMSKARVGPDKCIAEVLVPDTMAIMPSKFEYPFIIHPATLDSFIHAVFPVGSGHTNLEQGTPVPTFIDEMFVSHIMPKEPNHKFNIYAKSERKDLGNTAAKGIAHTQNYLSVFDAEKIDCTPIVTVTGLAFSSLSRAFVDETHGNLQKISHQTKWEPAPEFTSARQLVELTTHLRKRSKVQNELVQCVAFYYAEKALKLVPASVLIAGELHLRKLYKILEKYCASVYNGRLEHYDTSAWLKVDGAEREAFCTDVTQTSYDLLCHIGEHLPQILRGDLDPLTVMIEGDRLEKHYRDTQIISQCYEQAAAYVALLANKNPFLNVLEVGAGTGGATFPMLQALNGPDGPCFANYDFTDISPGFFEKVMDRTKNLGDLINFKILDIEKDPVEQGYQAGFYDLVIAANVLHATRCINDTLNRVRSLLKPGGTLILIEITVDNLPVTVMFGTLPGWWLSEEHSRENGPLLTEAQWDEALLSEGFTGIDVALWDMPDAQDHYISAMISKAKPEAVPKFIPDITILTESSDLESCVGDLERSLAEVDVSSNVTNFVDCDPKGQVCIVLSELTQSKLRNPPPAVFNAVKKIFLESAGVLWVTRGALIESSAPDFNLVTGIARTVRAEKGDTMLVTLDLEAASPHSAVADTIFSIFKNNFVIGNMEAPNLDTEYAVRGGLVMIPRIVEDKELTSFVSLDLGPPLPEDQQFYQKGRPLRAEIKTPGLLDSLQFVDDTRISGSLPENYVEIEVKAAGVNFRDVMSATGQIEPYPLGCECSGIITAVGKDVRDFQPGDHVIANVLGGCFCNSVRVPEMGLERIPKDMPFEIGAALPIVYFTAYYAVMKASRLRKGETVLVHAASGGLGQAILNLCQLVGAEIFATVGTLEKKNLIMSQFGIEEDHIFSSRDDTFAKGIMRRTKGKGVDVIMNSVSGDALRLTWNCIAPFGRFVELGKRDCTVNSRLEMRHFEKNVSFIGLDVPLHTNFEEKRRIWSEVMLLYQQGQIKPPHPIKVFGVSELEKALRLMQSGKHTGKLVLVPRHDEIVRAIPRDNNDGLLRVDASYLLIGMGGIGRAIASWMVDRGARYLIFASPSGLDKEKARAGVALLKARGATVAVFKCDVSSIAEVDGMLDECRKGMPPIRGMIHAAMVPKADLFENMSVEDYNEIMRPKTDGTWNLHNRLSKTELDFFILLSSQVGAVGNPSQAPYVAASVFLDAFSDFRNKQGLPAVTLDLGRVAGVGFVAENAAAQRGTKDLWSRDIEPDEIMAMIKDAIITPIRKGRSGSSLTGMKQWEPEASPVFLAPIFAHYRRAALTAQQGRGQGSGSAARVREMLRDASSLEAAATCTYDAMVTKMSALLMIPAEEISSSKSMSDYGMDSLVAVEMRNWLVRELDATLPVLELLANVSLMQLSTNIARKSKLTNPAILKEEKK